MMEECFAYDDELRRGGHFLGREALDLARNIESPLISSTKRPQCRELPKRPPLIPSFLVCPLVTYSAGVTPGR